RCLNRVGISSGRTPTRLTRVAPFHSRARQVQVPAHLGNQRLVNAPAPQRHTAHEGVVADHVDRARYTAGQLVDERHGLQREHLRRHPACSTDAAGDIRRCVTQFERQEITSERDPLLQLPKVGVLQPVGQLRLTGEHERQKFFRWRLDVREQPNLLEELSAQALRLVDNQGRRLASLSTFPQTGLQPIEKDGFRRGGLGSQVELLREEVDEVRLRQHRVVEIDASNVPAALGGQRRLNERGLAGASVPHQERERLHGHQAVLEVAERLALLRRQEQKARIGRQLERPFTEPVELLVHRRAQERRRQTTTTATASTSATVPAMSIQRWRHWRSWRSRSDDMTGIRASTGSESAAITSSSVRKLLSRSSWT